MFGGYDATVANVFGDVAQLNQLHVIGVIVTLVASQVATIVTLLAVPVTQIQFPQGECKQAMVKLPPLHMSMSALGSPPKPGAGAQPSLQM